MPRPRSTRAWLVIFVGLMVWQTGARARSDEPPAPAGAARPLRMTGAADVAAFQQVLFDCIDAAGPSVVAISRLPPPSDEAPPTAELNPFGLQLQEQLGQPADTERTPLDFLPSGFGAGVIVHVADGVAERLILTNHHVVRGGTVAGTPADPRGDRLYVHLPGGRGTLASIVAADPRSDLAVLQLEAIPGWDLTNLKPMRLAGPAELRRGQLVVVLGNPYAIARDGNASASLGMISNVSRYPAAEGSRIAPHQSIHQLGTLVTVDARLGLGTSGGALVNLDGELVGLTTSLAALQGYEKSVGYAIPLDASMQRVIHDLARGFEVDHAYLGIEPRNALPHEVQALRQMRDGFTQEAAVLVRMVTQNSPAAQSGIQNDDVILSVNGHPIQTYIDVHREVGLLEAGTQVPIRVLRREDGQRRALTLAVELGKWPVEEAEQVISTQPRHAPWRGISVDFPTARRKWIADPYRYPQAVVVTQVPSAKERSGGLVPGNFVTHVNETPVQTPREFHEAARRLAGEVTLRLLDGTQRTVPP